MIIKTLKYLQTEDNPYHLEDRTMIMEEKHSRKNTVKRQMTSICIICLYHVNSLKIIDFLLFLFKKLVYDFVNLKGCNRSVRYLSRFDKTIFNPFIQGWSGNFHHLG